MSRKVSQLQSVTSPISSDLIPISRSLSGSWESNSITFENFVKDIQSSGTLWGTISGDLTQQTDLYNNLLSLSATNSQLSSIYLKLDGSNSMTGNLNFNTGAKIGTNSLSGLTFDSYSVVLNPTCSATGLNSVAEGNMSRATASYSHAEGRETRAAGLNSHTEGYLASATALYSHAEGNATLANGIYTHAEGSGSRATGLASHADGDRTIAQGQYSHAEGRLSHAVHNNTFIWSSYNTPVSTTNTEQFVVSAANGLVLGSRVDVNGTLYLNNVSLSGINKFENTFTTVNQNSAIWSLTASDVNLGDIPALSGNWNSVYSSYNTNSSTYLTSVDLTDYLTITDAASTYQVIGNYLTSVDLTPYTPLSTYVETSGVYTTVQSNSANWESSVQNYDNVVFNTLSAYSVSAQSFVLNGSAISAWPTGGTGGGTWGTITGDLSAQTDLWSNLVTLSGRLVIDGGSA